MRKAEYPINQLFLDRWSSRAFSREMLTKDELFSLCEAARWAPSSYNNQPWRFVYALNGTPAWEAMFEVLVPFNQEWAAQAGGLVAIISAKNFEKTGKPSVTHSFDTGAAWMNFALQATLNNLVAHPMEGFDYQKLRENIRVPDEYAIEIMVAVGKPGRKEDLSSELQEMEQLSDRKPLDEIVFKETFGTKID